MYLSLRFGKVMEQHDALQLNALQLAYLGDSVWELIVRYNLIMQKFNVHHMHKDCVSLVNAHSQAVILQKINRAHSMDLSANMGCIIFKILNVM